MSAYLWSRSTCYPWGERNYDRVERDDGGLDLGDVVSKEQESSSLRQQEDSRGLITLVFMYDMFHY